MKLKTRIIVLALSFFLCIVMYPLLNAIHRKRTLQRLIKEEEMQAQINQHKPIIPEVIEAPEQVDSHMIGTGNFSNRHGESDKKDGFYESELARLRIDMESVHGKPWPWKAICPDCPRFYIYPTEFRKILYVNKIAASWVSERQIYPEKHPEMATILHAMTSAKITKADALPKGTQLKLLLYLEGDQRVVFKQKRYERDHVIEGKPYDGYDRHNGEVASFHLDRIFNFRRSPLTVGRILNLREEVLPVATERLRATFKEQGGNLCYYGVCYYCKESYMACADGDIMEGAVTLWLPPDYSNFQKLRHPYQRTYVNGRSAKWEVDASYCETTVKHTSPYDKGPRLLDITDGTVFDYLIGNADRHHYEVFKDKGPDVMLLMMDNAKSFGNPYWHEPSILAPLRQCCILRNSTWNRMKLLSNGVLTELLQKILESDPIAPVLHHWHYLAMDERLPHLIKVVEKCIEKRGRDNVLLNEWKGKGNPR